MTFILSNWPGETLRDTLINSTENGDEGKSVFHESVKFYPEPLYVAEEELPDFVLKAKQRSIEAES